MGKVKLKVGNESVAVSEEAAALAVAESNASKAVAPTILLWN